MAPVPADGGGGAKAPGAADKEHEKLLAATLKSFKELGLADSESAKSMEAELAQVRERRQNAKPAQAKHQSALNKLGRTKRELDEVKDKIGGLQEMLEELGKEKEELCEKQAALEADADEQEQYVRSLVAPAQPVPTSAEGILETMFGGEPEKVEGIPGFQQARQALQFFCDALAATQTHAGGGQPDANAHGAGSAGGAAEQPGGASAVDKDIEMPGMDDLFDDEALDSLAGLAGSQPADGEQANKSDEERAELRRRAMEVLVASKRRKVDAAPAKPGV